ncbi:hypothetical protein KBD45_07360 [Candidatus Dojkabacteria bacterium]|nr:hypothetical protein [Candidatus Dojkabacteria bacterium]
MIQVEDYLTQLNLQSLTPKEQIKILARTISEIPWGEARTVEDVLSLNCGTCHGKHLLLYACLDILNIKYKPVMCTIKWIEQGINFPQNIIDILNEGAWEHGHNFVTIELENSFDLDLTWNSKLKSVGFKTLPADWEPGTSFVGANYIKRWDGADVNQMKKDLIDQLTPEVRERRERFLKNFITWINSINK